MSRQVRRWGLVSLSWLAFVLRVSGLAYQSLWRDEVDAIRFANRPWAELLQAFGAPGQNGSLYFVLLRPWLALAGDSEFALRFFSLAFGVAAVPLIGRLARRLFPRQPWLHLVAALLAASSPYLVWYGQEGKMYSAVTVAVLLSMDRFLAAIADGRWRSWLSYVLATVALSYLHLTAVLIVPAQIAIWAVIGGWRKRASLLGLGFSLAALALPYLPLLVWQVPLLLKPASTGYAFVPLPQMATSLLESYGLGVLAGSPWWMLVPVVALLVAGPLLDRDGRLIAGGVLGSWLLLPVGCLFVITLSRPIYTARYLIFIVPAFLLLLAWGVVSVGRRSPHVAGVLLTSLLLVNGWGVWRQGHTPLKADFRAATRYVVSRLDSEDLLLFLIPHGRHSFDYYWPSWPGGVVRRGGDAAHRVFLPLLSAERREPYRWADGPYTNGGMDSAELDRRMAEATCGSRVVWLIATEVSMWDERGLVRAWLEAHGRLIDSADFQLVSVYRYEMP